MARRIRTTFAAICLTLVSSAAFAVAASPAGAAVPAAPRPDTATADAYCDVTFTVLAQWSTGYVAGFAVRNISSVPVRWRLVLTFPGPVLSIQVWNATYSQSGSVATIIPVPPSDLLQPGQSIMVGVFVASGSVVILPRPEVTCSPA
jgi:cellulase/cellobiase CelA1